MKDPFVTWALMKDPFIMSRRQSFTVAPGQCSTTIAEKVAP
jgi:hypothetical protein